MLYLDLETSTLGERNNPGQIVLITYCRLDQPNAPIRQQTIWNHGTEDRLIEQFEKETSFYRRKWPPVVGFNLEFDMPLMRDRGIRLGHLDFVRPWKKPRIDLQQIIYFLNWDSRPQRCHRCELGPCRHMGPCPERKCSCMNTGKADNEEHQIPNCYFGAKLSRFSAKKGDGTDVPRLYAEKRFREIESYAFDECLAFIELYRALGEEGPKWWRNVLAPRLGVEVGT